MSRRLLPLVLACMSLVACEQPSPTERAEPPVRVPAVVQPGPDFGAVQPSPDLRRLVEWIVASGDHDRRAFAVIDKRGAMLHVFDRSGRLIDSAPVLLGQAIGDDSAPGVGGKAIVDIPPDERTTPAGRFVTVPGLNAEGKSVVWLDYDAGLSMHIVINETPSERRLERLASADPTRRRISWGCINVPAPFFVGVVQSAFSTRGGIVYVLPESRSLTEFFALSEASTRPAISAAPHPQQ